jgi:hypothetical protein
MVEKVGMARLLDFCAIWSQKAMWFPSSLSVTHYDLSRTSIYFPSSLRYHQLKKGIF